MILRNVEIILFGIIVNLISGFVFCAKDNNGGSDDFVLEHVIGNRDCINLSHKHNEAYGSVGNFGGASSIFQRMMLMKMFRMVAPRGQGKHRIKYYSGKSKKVEEFTGPERILQKTTGPMREDIYPAYDDPETVSNFAKMTSNAYFARVFSGWRNITDYDTVDGFGWDAPGLRGYIFVNKARDIVIISFKGTSILLAGGDTVNRDKDQDNKMFSCCCGRVDIYWVPVCGCYSGGYLSRAQSSSIQCLKSTLQGVKDS